MAQEVYTDALDPLVRALKQRQSKGARPDREPEVRAFSAPSRARLSPKAVRRLPGRAVAAQRKVEALRKNRSDPTKVTAKRMVR